MEGQCATDPLRSIRDQKARLLAFPVVGQAAPLCGSTEKHLQIPFRRAR
jgi:hypothetical protein